MVYYIMAQHPELVFLLRERKSSSLIHLFEDAIEVEENIRASRWTHKQVDLHIQEEEDYQPVSESEQGYSNYGSDLEQEPRSGHYDLDPAAPLFEYHLSGVEAAAAEDPEWFFKEGEGRSFVSREIFAEEHPGLLKRPGFCHNPHDPMAICMESYISDFLKCSNNISPPILTGSTEQRKAEGRQLISCSKPVCRQVSSGIGQPASILRPLVHSEGSEEDFPVFKVDALSNSFEDIIEDFLDALASAPDEPVVPDLSEEAIVEEDCSFFLHQISHDVFTFGMEEKDRETVPFLQDGRVQEEPEEQLSAHFIVYPEPVCGKVSSGIGQPAFVLHPLVHSEDIMPQVNNHGGQEMFSDQLNSPGIIYCDPVGSYMELCFPKALEPINLFPFSTFRDMDIMINLIFIWLSYLPSILWSICGKEKGRITKQYGWLWWKFAFT
jgi:hypothetical protein